MKQDKKQIANENEQSQIDKLKEELAAKEAYIKYLLETNKTLQTQLDCIQFILNTTKP